MKRLVLTLVAVVATLLGVSSLAPSGVVVAQYPPVSPPRITTDVPTVQPGGSFTATASNCLPGETIEFTFQGATRTVTCNGTTLQASVPVTAPTAPGTYEVCAVYTGTGASVPTPVTRPQTVCTTIQVLAGPPLPPGVPGGGLPATGSSGISSTTTSAIVLIGAGVALLVVTQIRRRRNTHVAA